MAKAKDRDPTYYFIDVELRTQRIIGWGCEPKNTVEVHLTRGFHRVFLTKGQYNKLVADFESEKR